MKTNFPLGRMSIHEMESLDVNRDNYKTVYELTKKYKGSHIYIKICLYDNEFFFGLSYLIRAKNIYHAHSFAPLRKWGTYSSLQECKEDAVKQIIHEIPNCKKEKIILKHLNFPSYKQGELFE